MLNTAADLPLNSSYATAAEVKPPNPTAIAKPLPKVSRRNNRNMQAKSRYTANKRRLKRKGLLAKAADLKPPKLVKTVKAKPVKQLIKLKPKTRVTVQYTMPVWHIGSGSYLLTTFTLAAYMQSITAAGTAVCYVPRQRLYPIGQNIVVSLNATGLQLQYVIVQNTLATAKQLAAALKAIQKPKVTTAAAAKAAAAEAKAATAKARVVKPGKTAKAKAAAASAAVKLHNKRFALLNRT